MDSAELIMAAVELNAGFRAAAPHPDLSATEIEAAKLAFLYGSASMIVAIKGRRPDVEPDEAILLVAKAIDSGVVMMGQARVLP